jgi:hypothetical protein
MAGVTIAALMIIIRVSTSQTPASAGDDTMVLVSPYPSMDACANEWREVPLSDSEKEIELKYKLRVIRSCMPMDGARQYWYAWTRGSVSGDSVVETGPYRGR